MASKNKKQSPLLASSKRQSGAGSKGRAPGKPEGNSSKSEEKIRTVGINAIAQRLKITPRRVQQLVAEGLPREARGRYDVDQVLDWYIARLEKQIAGQSDEEGSLTYNKERARDRAAAADLKEIQLAKERRLLIAIPDMEKAMTDLVVSTKAAILAVPGRVSLSLVGSDAGAIHEKLQHELEEALSKLSGKQPDREPEPASPMPATRELCTWQEKDRRCEAEATHPQRSNDGSVWANLCSEHHSLLESAMPGKETEGDPRKMLAYWVKANGGAKKMAASMVNRP